MLNHLRKGGDFGTNASKSENQETDNGKTEEAIELIEKFRHKKLTLSKEEFTKLLEHFDFEDEAKNE